MTVTRPLRRVRIGIGPAIRDALATLHRLTRVERITAVSLASVMGPPVRGLRYPVEMLLEFLASGMTIEDYPDLEREDLLAALEFGAKTAGMRRVPLGAV